MHYRRVDVKNNMIYQKANKICAIYITEKNKLIKMMESLDHISQVHFRIESSN